MRFDHVNLIATDLDTGTRWYQQLFDMETVEGGVRNGRRWRILRKDDAMVCLYEDPEWTRDRAGTGIHHVGVRLTDVDDWTQRIERHLIPVDWADVQWPHSRSWYLRDPAGNELEVAFWDRDQVRFP